MLKKIAIAIVLVAIASIAASTAFAVSPQLPPGSYLFISQPGNFLRVKMNAGQIVSTKVIPVNMPGNMWDGQFDVNASKIVFAWQKGTAYPQIYSRNASTGWELHRITGDTSKIYNDPVLEPNGKRIGFSQIDPARAEKNIISMLPDGSLPRIEGTNGLTPAWQENGPITWTDFTTGRISIWNATGTWHMYLPDRSGILVQDKGNFYIWPAAGVPREFGHFRAVAIRPSGGVAAVVTEDGAGNQYLAFTKLDANWIPYGNLTYPDGCENFDKPGVTHCSWNDILYMKWIEVK